MRCLLAVKIHGLRISGAPDYKIEPAFIVFQNSNRSYPINGIADDVPDVCYRSQPNSSMDRQLFPAYFRDRAIRALPKNGTRILFVDNSSVHNNTPELQAALADIRTTLRRFPSNCTHLIQPLDQIVLRSLKVLFRKKWNFKRALISIQSNHNDSRRLPTLENTHTWSLSKNAWTN